MIPGDYCRCTGKDCERRDSCARFVAWRDKIGPAIISVAECLCHWEDGGKAFNDHYIPAAAMEGSGE